MDALWEATWAMDRREPLETDIATDVLVIGGGLTGILCAYFLRQAGVDAVVAEADRVGGGVTGRTTAKITAQHGLIYHQLLRTRGRTAAGQYLAANLAALDTYRALCAGIDCRFEEQNSYVYSLRDRSGLTRELATLHMLGYPAEWVEKPPLPFTVAGALRYPKQAQFHPLRFLSGLAKDLCVYERTPVRELIGTNAVTDRGRIAAKRIVVATHFPFLNKHGGYFLKLYQSRSYVLALKNAPLPEGMLVDEASGGLSFRGAEGLLLLGGGGHRTGKAGGGWQTLRRFAARHYPGAAERYHWATQDCMTLDGVPYIGRYGRHTEGLYVATGYGKWGMTSAMAAALLLTDLLQGKDNPYTALYDPNRSMLRPQLAVNGAEAALSLLTPTTPRCPHLGCALKWNQQEHSWDCPCHGSRFSGDGTLRNGPATGGLKK